MNSLIKVAYKLLTECKLCVYKNEICWSFIKNTAHTFDPSLFHIDRFLIQYVVKSNLKRGKDIRRFVKTN